MAKGNTANNHPLNCW